MTVEGNSFDAKVRRENFEPVNLFHASTGGMDAFARGVRTDWWTQNHRLTHRHCLSHVISPLAASAPSTAGLR